MDRVFRSRSYLLYSIDEDQVIKKLRPDRLYNAASLVKIIYALEIMHRLSKGELKDEEVVIGDDCLVNEGTNILRDLMLESDGKLELRVRTLVRLMLKHSCNGSTIAIWKILDRDMDVFKKRLDSAWLPSGSKIFDRNGRFVNMMSPVDVCQLYRHIYDKGELLDDDARTFLQECLREGKSRYSVFDQKGPHVRILGCKGGQLYSFGQKRAYYHASGVFEVGEKKYVVVTMSESLDLPSSRKWTRWIGEQLIGGVS